MAAEKQIIDSGAAQEQALPMFTKVPFNEKSRIDENDESYRHLPYYNVVRVLKYGFLGFALLCWFYNGLRQARITDLMHPWNITLPTDHAKDDPFISQSPTVQWDWCTPVRTQQKERHIELNFAAGLPRTLSFLDTTQIEAVEHLRGRRRIHVRKGSPVQPADVWVFVNISSSYEPDLDRVTLQSANTTVGFEYANQNNQVDLCTEIEVYIYLRPDIGGIVESFETHSEIFDIYLDDELNWEINNLVTYTAYGYTQVTALTQTNMISWSRITCLSAPITVRYFCTARPLQKSALTYTLSTARLL